MTNKPFFRAKKWKLGNSFGWFNVPYCPHCKRKLGMLACDKMPSECPMCHMELNWGESNERTAT